MKKKEQTKLRRWVLQNGTTIQELDGFRLQFLYDDRSSALFVYGSLREVSSAVKEECRSERTTIKTGPRV